MLGNLFKYEDDMLFKKNKQTKKWCCCNKLKPNCKGYIPIGINGKPMRLHRIIYLFHNVDWNIYDISSDNEIDHINGNKLDNKIENLRVANRSQNCQNKTHYNGKLVKGVSFRKNRNSWSAFWVENKIRKYKDFKTEAEALEHRTKMVEINYSHDPLKR